MAYSLKHQLAQGGPLDPPRAVNVVRQVATAIDHAHTHHSRRPEITVDTILLDDGDTVHLTDTGGATPSTDRTRTLVTDPATTYRADIAALAAVLYECLTGRPPTASGTAPVPRASEQHPGVPAGLDDVIARGLATDPLQQYRSAAELAAAAEGVLSAMVPAQPNPSAAATRSMQLPRPAPAPPNPAGAQWDPVHGRSPTVSYPHSRPAQMPLLPPPAQPRRLRRYLAPTIAAVLVVGAVAAGAIAIPRVVGHHGATASKTSPARTSTAPRRSYQGQPIQLPFPGMHPTVSVAVDGAGNVYALAGLAPPPDADVFEVPPEQLFKLAPGASTPSNLDFPGTTFRYATDLTVDKAGNIYYSYGPDVWLVESGKTIPIRLPFRGFSKVAALTVDAAGIVYAAGTLQEDSGLKFGVKKLLPGDNRPTDLPFEGLDLPRGITVDRSGAVYVSGSVKGSGRGQILKLSAGAAKATALPVPGLLEPRHLLFDSAGNMFISDGFNRALWEVPAGGTVTKIEMPAYTHGVAIDAADNLYVLTGAMNNSSDRITQPGQVLKIPPDN
ncbi:hypothetical protein [Mycobacterium sp. 1423905.2]|uniref:hypothetical protein n=1 Tax=Mycobacterium sp. 1423905.2 TaxID=1856859 RepID=UPI0007FFAC8D|nr:hypothetical protein [Mycobacterium sp. 1423905.2]OBJ54594.1 hypothetical protein A9W95_16705 [Mycobacterium sp. 1423905.2]